jgi:hypothetical protein
MSTLEYYQSHPPRCVRGFSATPMEFPQTKFDGHGEDLNPAFALACHCGSTQHRVAGYKVSTPEGSIFLSPLALECQACGKHSALLDTDEYGYDAELGHGSSTLRMEGELRHFQCQACSSDRLSVFMRFEYPPDLFDGSFDDTGREKEDLFSWVTCIGRCAHCSELWIVADFECA